MYTDERVHGPTGVKWLPEPMDNNTWMSSPSLGHEDKLQNTRPALQIGAYTLVRVTVRLPLR